MEKKAGEVQRLILTDSHRSFDELTEGDAGIAT